MLGTANVRLAAMRAEQRRLEQSQQEISVIARMTPYR